MTDTQDIEARLRAAHDAAIAALPPDLKPDDGDDATLWLISADEIARLREENERLTLWHENQTESIRTLIDAKADLRARATAAEARLAEVENGLRRISDRADDQDMNHLDFRVGVTNIVREMLADIAALGVRP